MRIIIKPAGVLILAGVLAVGGVLFVKRGAPPRAASAAPVGKPAAPPTKSPLGEVTDPGELNEKGMIATWNRDTAQARDWLFLGPLRSGEEIVEKANNQSDQEKMARIINKAYLPNEAKYAAREGATFQLAGTSYSWRKVHGSAFDFKNLFATPEQPMDRLKNMVVYGVTQFQSEKAQQKVIRFRSDDGAIVWLNGKQVYKNTAIRGVTAEDKLTLDLNSGKNTLLVKVGQGDGGWGLMVQFEDLSGLK